MTDLEQAQAAGVAPWDLTVSDLSNFHVTVFQDRFPVAVGHLLFVPNYNTSVTISDAFEAALIYGNRMVASGECDAFNVGINMGAAAGQTVMYPHIHFIPRRVGDQEDPTGGIRNIFPDKGNYKKSK
jgi:diadenosine tetraphosphate (Ap4A) HIT family hydrolase